MVKDGATTSNILHMSSAPCITPISSNKGFDSLFGYLVTFKLTTNVLVVARYYAQCIC